MSGYLDSVLAHDGGSRSHVIDQHEGFYVAALTVQTLWIEEQEVLPDPIDPPAFLCDPAHAQVIGSKAPSRRRRLARAALWIPGLGPAGGPALAEP
jgi:hypothetical protein